MYLCVGICFWIGVNIKTNKHTNKHIIKQTNERMTELTTSKNTFGDPGLEFEFLSCLVQKLVEVLIIEWEPPVYHGVQDDTPAVEER